MNKNSTLYFMAEPARRHRCELCNEVFVCHLCTLKLDHRFHSGSRMPDDPTMPVLVCEECAVTENCLSLAGCREGRRNLMVPYLNYQTGKTVLMLNKSVDVRRLNQRQKAYRKLKGV